MLKRNLLVNTFNIAVIIVFIWYPSALAAGLMGVALSLAQLTFGLVPKAEEVTGKVAVVKQWIAMIQSKHDNNAVANPDDYPARVSRILWEREDREKELLKIQRNLTLCREIMLWLILPQLVVVLTAIFMQHTAKSLWFSISAYSLLIIQDAPWQISGQMNEAMLDGMVKAAIDLKAPLG